MRSLGLEGGSSNCVPDLGLNGVIHAPLIDTYLPVIAALIKLGVAIFNGGGCRLSLQNQYQYG